jgi:ribonuclease P/MRP protein subunit RPP1
LVERYYDLCIRYLPEDDQAMERLLSLATHFGFKGAGIAQVPNSKPVASYTGPRNSFFDLVHGVDIHEENPSKLHSQISRYAKKVDFVMVEGGADKLNRSAVEAANVNILSLPFGIKDGGLDHVIAKSAADRSIAIEFDVGSLIRYRGGKRVHAMSELGQRLMLARKFDVHMVLTSGARSIYDIRGPRELIALASLFGMTKEEAINAMTAIPAAILRTKRKTHGFIMDGVELIEEQVPPERQEEFC